MSCSSAARTISSPASSARARAAVCSEWSSIGADAFVEGAVSVRADIFSAEFRVWDTARCERLTRKLRIREQLGDAPEYPFPAWVWRAGDALFVGTPGEAYSDLQLTLRRTFPEHAVTVMNIVNGSIGYLPPDRKPL